MTLDDRHRSALGIAAVATSAFLLVSIAVASGVSQPLDDMARQWLRPDDTWGAVQQATRPIIDGLEPRRVFLLLALVGIGASVAHSSFRPLGYVGAAGLTSSALTVLTKYALDRVDPNSEQFGGGSYPSGHMVAVLVSLGCMSLLLLDRTRWWTWLAIGIVGSAMAAALLFTAAHWLTDVVGGVLLAVAVLAVLSTLSLRSASAPEGSDPAH